MNFYQKVILLAVAITLNVGVAFAQTSPYAKPAWGNYTMEDGLLFAHVLDWPEDGKLIIDENIRLKKASFVTDEKSKLKSAKTEAGLTVYLPESAPNSTATVIKLELLSEDDWANLGRYAGKNAALKAPLKKENRVVFMGNSITQNWTRDHGVFFENNPSFVNRGISGQTSAQMLLRFRPDVIELQPKVVVISAGTNDLAGNRGPTTVDEIAGNIFSMAELAKGNNIRVILAAILPASSYSWSPAVTPADDIIALNTKVKDYAKANDMIYLDYYTPMVNSEKGLKEELGRDTVHPNMVGYEIMEPLVQEAIAKAMKSN